jgi:hypothetical protein
MNIFTSGVTDQSLSKFWRLFLGSASLLLMAGGVFGLIWIWDYTYAAFINERFVLSVFLAIPIFLISIFSSILLWFSKFYALLLGAIMFLLQIPYVLSGLISYEFNTGIGLNLSASVEYGADFMWRFGGMFFASFNTGVEPNFYGINLIAAAYFIVFCLLISARANKRMLSD